MRCSAKKNNVGSNENVNLSFTRSIHMLLNRLRGTVADRPIDSQVVQTEINPDAPNSFNSSTTQPQTDQPSLAPVSVSSLIDRLADVLRGQNLVQYADVSRLPNYELG